MKEVEEPSIITAAAASGEVKSDFSLDAGDAMPSFHRAQRRFCRRWFPLFMATMMIAVMAMPLLFMATSRSTARRGDDGEVRGTSSIVVVVMPSPPIILGPLSRVHRLLAIRNTWAQNLLSESLHHDDATGERSTSNYGVVFVLDEGDPAVGIALEDMDWKLLEEHHQQAKGNRLSTESDSRVTVVPKTVSQGGKDGDSRLRHVLAKVSRVYNPDFIFLCNDYTFVIAENLRCLVQNFDHSQPIYVGNQFRGKDRRPWINLTGNNMTSREVDEAMLNSGGAGILLSRGSLSLLGKAWGLIESSTPSRDVEAIRRTCMARSEYEKTNPGVVLARCLEHYGVEAQDSTDERGGQRFNLYGPVLVAQGFVQPGFRLMQGSDDDVWRNGLQGCSSETVTFHYVTPAETYAIHHIMHNKEKFLEDGYEKASLEWPSWQEEDLGPFTAVPRRGGHTFNLLLKRIEICSSSSSSVE